jgi:hypothetical protein
MWLGAWGSIVASRSLTRCLTTLLLVDPRPAQAPGVARRRFASAASVLDLQSPTTGRRSASPVPGTGMAGRPDDLHSTPAIVPGCASGSTPPFLRWPASLVILIAVVTTIAECGPCARGRGGCAGSGAAGEAPPPLTLAVTIGLCGTGASCGCPDIVPVARVLGLLLARACQLAWRAPVVAAVGRCTPGGGHPARQRGHGGQPRASGGVPPERAAECCSIPSRPDLARLPFSTLAPHDLHARQRSSWPRPGTIATRRRRGPVCIPHRAPSTGDTPSSARRPGSGDRVADTRSPRLHAAPGGAANEERLDRLHEVGRGAPAASSTQLDTGG